MSIFKIILCIILGLIGVYAGICGTDLRDLTERATKEEKKSLTIIKILATFSPMVIAYIIYNQ